MTRDLLVVPACKGALPSKGPPCVKQRHCQGVSCSPPVVLTSWAEEEPYGLNRASQEVGIGVLLETFRSHVTAIIVKWSPIESGLSRR